jgi:hypothetical protein
MPIEVRQFNSSPCMRDDLHLMNKRDSSRVSAIRCADSRTSVCANVRASV